MVGTLQRSIPADQPSCVIERPACGSQIASLQFLDTTPKIRIAAPAIENAANQALVEFVAQQLGIAKRCVRVVAGGASRRKVLEIDGVTAEVVAAALGAKT